MNLAIPSRPIFSTFGDDPELGELVEMFVQEMPDRMAHLQSSWNKGDRESLGRAAHQMKGSAGSYGFDVLTQQAARLERTIKTSEPEAQVLAELNSLIDMCARTRAGIAQPTEASVVG